MPFRAELVRTPTTILKHKKKQIHRCKSPNRFNHANWRSNSHRQAIQAQFMRSPPDNVAVPGRMFHLKIRYFHPLPRLSQTLRFLTQKPSQVWAHTRLGERMRSGGVSRVVLFGIRLIGSQACSSLASSMTIRINFSVSGSLSPLRASSVP